jgi:hypothetical protein
MSFLFNNRGVSHLSLPVTDSDTELRIPWEDFNSFMRSNARAVDRMMAILRGPIEREIVEIDLNNSFSGTTDKYLKVTRGQGGTISEDWPAGTLLFLSTHADHYEACFQPDSTRQIDYNPNGVLAPDYQGEKILQYSGCAVRWWQSFDAINPYWHLIAGEPCVGEEFIDPGWGFKVWIVTVAQCLEQHFDNSNWTGAAFWPGSWDGTKWVHNQYFRLDAIGAWADGYRPSLIKVKLQNFCERGAFQLFDTDDNVIAENDPWNFSQINLGTEGRLWHIDWSNGLDIKQIYVQGIFTDPEALTDIEFYTTTCGTQATPITVSGGDAHLGGPETFDWPSARNASNATAISTTGDVWAFAHRWSPYYRVYRSFLDFDLSGLGALFGAPIWEVELHYFGLFTSGSYLHNVGVQESIHTQPLQLWMFQYGYGPFFNAAPLMSRQSSQQSFWFNQAGRDYVAGKLGIGSAKFCIKDYYDIDNIAPTHGPWFHTANSYDGGYPAELRIYGDF